MLELNWPFSVSVCSEVYFQLHDMLIVVLLHVSDKQIFGFSTYPGLINSFSINKFVVRRE